MKLLLALSLIGILTSHLHAQARGPLRVHPTNPRYFTDGTKGPDGSLKAIYLTGSHTWSTLQDLGETNPPRAFDFAAYLNFLTTHGHNFIRLWRWEMTEWPQWKEGKPPFRYGVDHPWKRTGPGLALDGLPKFDLTQWDDAHFERLRDRVRAAGERGIYVSIMLFEGSLLRGGQSPWAGFPMNAANNVNGIDGDPNGDGCGLEVQMLRVPTITELQQTYIRKVVDAVNDLDNVLYEISNESLYRPEILKWQETMLQFLNQYQAGKPKQHPVGMTPLIGYSAKERADAQAAIDASAAAWVSPNMTAYGPTDSYSIDPPAATGHKVEILDTDHTWNNACMIKTGPHRLDRADGVWVWKSFLRGYNPIYMDPLDLTRPNAMMKYVDYCTAAVLSARTAMGQTRRLAERVNLAAMTPQPALASTGYCLASPGREYLICQPGGAPFTVNLTTAPGQFTAEWIRTSDGKSQAAADIAGGANVNLVSPWPGQDTALRLLVKK